MTLLNTINVGGTDFKVAGVAILGSCPTPAGSEVKVCTFTDDFELKAGDMLLVKFTYANTYGDGSTTYPKLQVNGTNYVMRRADGNYLQSGEWDSNATLTFLFDGTDFILPAGSLLLNTVDTVEAGNLHAVTSNAVANYIKNLSGTFTVTVGANGYTNQGISFGETLPNKNYVVQYRAVSAGSILFTEINRETTGTTVNVRNLNDSQLTITCEWFLICKG